MLKELLLKITVRQEGITIPAKRTTAVLAKRKQGKREREQISSFGNSSYSPCITSYVGAMRGQEVRRDKMYISPFWRGFVSGAVAMLVGIIAWCEWYNRRNK